MAAPSLMRRSASPRLVAPHTNGHGERPLVDVVGLVGRGEHLGLVDVVDAERLEHLRLDEVADAGLGHHRDGDDRLDALDHLGVGHAGDATVAPDVGRHPLEGHHGHGAGVLGDLGLLRVDDVHDHAALEHLGQPPLHAGGAGVVADGAGGGVGHASDRTVGPVGSRRRNRRATASWRRPAAGSTTQVRPGREQDRVAVDVGVGGDGARASASSSGPARARRPVPPPVSTQTSPSPTSCASGIGTPNWSADVGGRVVDELDDRRWPGATCTPGRVDVGRARSGSGPSPLPFQRYSTGALPPLAAEADRARRRRGSQVGDGLARSPRYVNSGGGGAEPSFGMRHDRAPSTSASGCSGAGRLGSRKYSPLRAS